jgi:predicted nucleic acid-binding protein
MPPPVENIPVHFLKDPKDDLVLEVAAESRSQFIVTHNTKDFNNVSLFGLKAITPRDFLEVLKEDKS